MINESDTENRYRTFMGSVRASFQIIDCLSLSATGSFNQYSGSSSSYKSKYYPQDAVRNGEASVDNYWNVTKLLDVEANFNKKFGDHSLQALAGYSYSDNAYETSYMWNKDYDTDYFKWHNIGSGSGLQNGQASMSSSKETSKLIAFSAGCFITIRKNTCCRCRQDMRVPPDSEQIINGDFSLLSALAGE